MTMPTVDSVRRSLADAVSRIDTVASTARQVATKADAARTETAPSTSDTTAAS